MPNSAQIEAIARVAHAANCEYNDQIGEENFEFELVGESIIDGVEQALLGLSPRALHQNWIEFKEADGWEYGTVKDLDKKTHPCLVPYDELPEEQRVKDRLFAAIVGALAS